MTAVQASESQTPVSSPYPGAPMSFDPAREWLGVDAIDLADPHRVLGISRSESDPAVITAAAERQLAVLRSVEPGPFARAHAALLARVEEARDAVLAAATAHPGRAAELPLNPAPPLSPAPPLPPVAPALQPPSAADGGLEVPRPPEALEEHVPSPFPAATAGRSRRRRRPGSADSDTAFGFAVGVLSTLAVAVAVVAFFVSQRKEPDVARRVSPATGGSQPPSRPSPVRRPRAPDTGKPERQRSPRPNREQDQRRSQPDESPAATAAVTPPSPPPEPPSSRPSAEAFDSALGDAYRALQRQEFDTADRAIASAGKHVGDDVEAVTRVERWRLLATYARKFIGYREQAFQSARAGREYQLGDTRFSVIEITPEKFIYKLRGKTERVARDQVDPRIELAIVEAWFDGRAANHLFLGANAICLDPPNLGRARDEWQRAGKEGQPLLALLDDPVIRRAGGR